MQNEDNYDPAIRIVEYDPQWPKAFQREAAALRSALETVAVRIDHVGSTSVPGLAAKPIIDINISVQALDPMGPYHGPLEALGYQFTSDPDSPDLHFFGKPAQRPRTHHVHVSQAGSIHEQGDLAFREYLTSHPNEAERYVALKRRLAVQHPGDRLAYIAGKDPFVIDMKAQALNWARESAGVL